jgi:DeoR/GlpR family transcriptional regulator of sugar metabolism
MAVKTLSVAEIAEKLDVAPRTVRKFLRSITPEDRRPGKGATWVLREKDFAKLQTKFTEWQERKARVVEVNFDGDELNSDGESAPAVLNGVSLEKS